jgi:hypothetical protein
MSRNRLAALAAMLTCALMLLPAAGASAAQTATKLTKTKTVNVNGTTKSGKKFHGKYTINRFIAKGNKTYAVGKLTGRLAGKKVTKHGVKMPVALTQTAQSAQLPPIPGACQILNLSIQPINLNLLGLSVRTSRIDVAIDAIPGAGNLLGNLLCGITNILNPATPPSAGQLAGILNALLALLNAGA